MPASQLATYFGSTWRWRVVKMKKRTICTTPWARLAPLQKHTHTNAYAILHLFTQTVAHRGRFGRPSANPLLLKGSPILSRFIFARYERGRAASKPTANDILTIGAQWGELLDDPLPGRQPPITINGVRCWLMMRWKVQSIPIRNWKSVTTTLAERRRLVICEQPIEVKFCLCTFFNARWPLTISPLLFGKLNTIRAWKLHLPAIPIQFPAREVNGVFIMLLCVSMALSLSTTTKCHQKSRKQMLWNARLHCR